MSGPPTPRPASPVSLRPVAIPPALLAQAAIPHPRPYAIEFVVGDDDVSDVVPHLNNVTAMRWIDRIAELHAESVGFGRAALRDAGVMWFVSRHEVDYLAECHHGERLLVCTWIRSVAQVKSWRDTVIVRPDANDRGLVAVRAATLWVLVDLPTRRPRRVPDPMARAFDPLETAGNALPATIAPPCAPH